MTSSALATMEDVAALAGVSTSTVSRALRNSPLISPATRQRVHEAADRLDFALSRTASALASGRLGRIGILVGGPLDTWFNSSVLEAAYDTLRQAEHELVIYRLRDATERDDFFTRLPARRNVDALVVASFVLRPDEYDRLSALSVPVVYLNQTVPDRASVYIDDAAASAAGTRHLINLGHRRISYVTTRNPEHFSFSASTRFSGVRQAVDRHNASCPDDRAVDPVRVVVDAPGAGVEVGRLAVARLLSDDQLPTAVVTETDEIAISLLPALGRAGLRVPTDLSVLGFDDDAHAAYVDLTTIAQPVAELGRRAAEAALALSSGGEPSRARQHQALPTRLVLRGTTAVPRTSDGEVG